MNNKRFAKGRIRCGEQTTNLKFFLSALFCIVVLNISSAQKPQYVSAMERHIKLLDTATTGITLWQAANGFERIANSEKSEWLPYYWAAYSFVMLTMKGDKEQIDMYCDRAEKFIMKADSISPDNSEIWAMWGFIDAMRIGVNPMMRGRVYGPKSSGKYDKAMKLDDNNPRPYYLRGQGIMNTPVMFGGGAEKACPYLQKSVERYEKFKPANSLMPDWGGERTKKVRDENCK